MTKQKKLVRNAVKGFLSLIVLSLFATFISCDNGHDESVPTPAVKYKVVFKAEASAGSNITSATYSFDGDPDISITGLSGTTWTSSETADYLSTAKVKVNATGASATSTLKVQILVDGVVKKEVISTGQALTATATISF